jgi:hypothetical protein
MSSGDLAVARVKLMCQAFVTGDQRLLEQLRRDQERECSQSVVDDAAGDAALGGLAR